jgi:hypothetical protein
VIDWDDAAASLESLLEHAARLTDGDVDVPPPVALDLTALDLSAPPDGATLDHVRALLAQVPDAVQALENAKTVVSAELDDLSRHRTAATAYARAPVAPSH